MLVIGLFLVGVAVTLLLAEAHLSTGGLIGIGAVVALAGGVALLAAGSSIGLLGALAISVGACVAAATGLAIFVRSLARTRRQRPRSGPTAMVGRLGVMRITATTSQVFVNGELWRAAPSPLNDSTELHDGDRVIVEHINGLTLSVRKAEELDLVQ